MQWTTAIYIELCTGIVPCKFCVPFMLRLLNGRPFTYTKNKKCFGLFCTLYVAMSGPYLQVVTGQPSHLPQSFLLFLLFIVIINTLNI